MRILTSLPTTCAVACVCEADMTRESLIKALQSACIPEHDITAILQYLSLTGAQKQLIRRWIEALQE